MRSLFGGFVLLGLSASKFNESEAVEGDVRRPTTLLREQAGGRRLGADTDEHRAKRTQTGTASLSTRAVYTSGGFSSIGGRNRTRCRLA